MSPVTIAEAESPAAYEEDSFISVAELGSYLGRNLSSDAGAELAVQAATDYCRTMAEQTFTAVSNDTVILDGTGTDALLLPQLPVTKVRSVKDDGEIVTDWTLNDNGIVLHTTGLWGTARQQYTVAYDHGYETIPDDIRRVAFEIAARMVVQGVASFESSGSQQIRYGVNSTDLSNGERMILRKYKRSR